MIHTPDIELATYGSAGAEAMRKPVGGTHEDRVKATGHAVARKPR
jgi:hypothetical protein